MVERNGESDGTFDRTRSLRDYRAVLRTGRSPQRGASLSAAELLGRRNRILIGLMNAVAAE